MAYKCPFCGSEDTRPVPVKGEYGTYDMTKRYCRQCWGKFPKPPNTASTRRGAGVAKKDNVKVAPRG
jgi:transcriptional regulator NrdR family protein